VICIPSPESPAKRITTFDFSSTIFVIAFALVLDFFMIILVS
jgi:hypothetical protein